MGLRVLNRFRLEERLGAGGNGTVFRAWDERLERSVAVKVIESPPEGRRVLREAQAAARLNHPSIATLYELGEAGACTYLVSELVRGASLRVLHRQEAVSDRDVATIGAEMCEALEHAHERGVIHRDIKPDNVLVAAQENGGPGPWSHGARGRAKLGDFGIASVTGGEALTATGEVIGTLAYMAPEQADGEEAGREADVYSLALTLYECWAGKNPRVGRTPAQTAQAIGGRLPALGASRPDLPDDLCAVIDECLDPLPERRPAVAELHESLLDWIPWLDATTSLAPAAPARTEARPLVRVAAIAAIGLVIAAVWSTAERPGLAIAIAAIALPLPLLLPRPREWAIPAAAPLLAVAGVAPLYAALAGLAGSVRWALALGMLGFGWLLAAGVLFGVGLPLTEVERAAPGWHGSAGVTVRALLEPLTHPAVLAAAAIWTFAPVLLALALAIRNPALQALGALVWGAGLVAAQRILPDWQASDPGLLALGLACLAVAVAWTRAGMRLGGPPGRAKHRPPGEPAASVPAGSLP